MRTALLAGLLIAAPAAALPVDRLASLVGDRVPGVPVDCIEASEIDQVHLVAGGIVYTMRSPKTVYLNRPETGAGFVHDGITPAVDRGGALLCSRQPVRLLNENSGMAVATIRLGRFVPYTRAVTP